MYLEHFGLKSRPFHARVSGSDVFVGPQTVQSMGGIRSALQAPDAVVAVSGPAGVGKSSIVAKAMDAGFEAYTTVRIDRMTLAATDILEYLLQELGSDDLPKGTIRRFASFRRHLNRLETDGTRLAIVVEDALLLGADTLAELEALTAADSGESSGASIVLMGDERLADLLASPQLTRLVQRIRHHNTVHPLSAAEMRGYLMHCFRQAGGEFTQVFDDSSSSLIHDLSNGIPRLANKIADSAMLAAAESGNNSVTVTEIAKAANNEVVLGTETSVPLVPQTITAPEPDYDAYPSSDDESYMTDDTDTLPDLQTLIPELMQEQEVEPESPDSSIPDWEKDPTLAELRPDLDALEKAMALSQSETSEAPKAQPGVAEDAEPATNEFSEIPEITLDDSIQECIENSLIDEPGQISAAVTQEVSGSRGDSDLPEIKLAPRTSRKADQQLERISEELAKAKAVDEMGENAADTLFGEELSFIAAQVVANGSVAKSATGGIIKSSESSREPGIEQASGEQRENVSALQPEQEQSTGDGGTDSMPAPPVGSTAQPKPIEDQIDTSLTQTLKALDVRPPISGIGSSLDFDQENVLGQKKNGFLGRFRR
jgi:type II secretory pathway predicted ATPase ExeA